ncbi:hypothetical protein ACFL4Y_00130 [Gemmatimonadota bacterium]
MKRHHLRKLLLLVVGLALTVGCSKPTAPHPDFPFEGSWSGQFTDFGFVDVETLEPLTIDLVMNVMADGSATASGEAAVESLMDRISMTFDVLTDGSVQGSGTYSILVGSETLLSVTGDVMGQLDRESETGLGTLRYTLDGFPQHILWSVWRDR